MIEFSDEDMFSLDLDVLVNTVNCKGIMGRGIALQFKNIFPQYFQDYKNMCKYIEITPGTVIVHTRTYLDLCKSPKQIISFFTKDHWKYPSKIDWIEDGLTKLKTILQFPEFSNKTIGIPPLGCGNGGLNWYIVRKLMEEKLSDCTQRIVIFNPRKGTV